MSTRHKGMKVFELRLPSKNELKEGQLVRLASSLNEPSVPIVGAEVKRFGNVALESGKGISNGYKS